MQPNQQRCNIKSGLHVKIILKQNQKSGKLTEGIVKDILTNSPTHPQGIKVRLMDSKVGRVATLIWIKIKKFLISFLHHKNIASMDGTL